MRLTYFEIAYLLIGRNTDFTCAAAGNWLPAKGLASLLIGAGSWPAPIWC